MLFDTSALIKMFKEKEFQMGAISVITLIEFLRGIPKNKRSKTKKLLEEAFDIIPLDNHVILEYCNLYEELRKTGSLIPDADLIIAASAKTKNLKLITMDKHFEKLKNQGLEIEIIQT